MSTLIRIGCLLFIGSMTLTGCNRRAGTEAPSASTEMLAVGAKLPDIAGIDQQGKEHRLASKQGQTILVYFYPKDGTPGCTKEACAFRDVWDRFARAGVSLYGVSRDDQASHARFANEHHIPFPLIADADGKWADAFHVPSNNGKSRRVSFLFDRQGQLARAYSNVDPGVHADEVLRDVAALP
jgi:thioredoxin-dependent peroxiredoxin